MILIGTAGWSIPRAEQDHFPGGGSHLERYARRFAVAEINSSFHRSHRAATWARWRESVSATFRFSVKVPKAITHTAGLKDSSGRLASFIEEVSGLESRLGAFLVQLPPKLVFNSAVAEEFFGELRASTSLPIVCEPRHESWFGEPADRLLQSYEVARVAADPARVASAGEPGGWRGMSYYRLHGSPKMYYSAYATDFIAALAARVKEDAANRRNVWVIFDNTTLGAATRNALELAEELHVR
ncbi:MAG: DUF72 domain-containing protein [Chthoniobacterales bacterium]